MSDKLLKAIIGKARIAIDIHPIRINDRDRIAIISRKVRLDSSDCKEILRILKKT